MYNFNAQHKEKTWKRKSGSNVVDSEMKHLEKGQIFVSFHNIPCCYASGSCAVFLKALQVVCPQRDCSITRFSALTLDLKFWAQHHKLIIIIFLIAVS